MNIHSDHPVFDTNEEYRFPQAPEPITWVTETLGYQCLRICDNYIKLWEKLPNGELIVFDRALTIEVAKLRIQLRRFKLINAIKGREFLMNIFFLDRDPEKAAAFHCDKHVVKMCLETAQIISTIHWKVDPKNSSGLYKPTHENHPCVLWAGSSYANYSWTRSLLEELGGQYSIRFGLRRENGKEYFRKHASVVLVLYQHCPLRPEQFNSLGWSDPPQCMPDEFKCEDPVNAYRDYYVGAKSAMLKYTNVPKPPWLDSPF